MENQYLKYGCCVTISTVDDYYLFSEGFLDCIPFLQKIKDSQQDFTGSLFRVHPYSSYSIQNSIIKYIKSIKKEEFYNQINYLMKLGSKLEGEIKNNFTHHASLNGESIPYGALVQLEHIRSQKYLTLQTKKKADFEKNNFKLTLEEFPSENSHFVILPSYSYQNCYSYKVKICEKVYLQTFVSSLIRKKAWIHSKSTEVNCSLDDKTRWKINLYDKSTQFKYLSCGDYCWLFLTEVQQYLSVQKNGWESQECKLVFQSEKDSNGLWLIQGKELEEGGEVLEEKEYRLRHLTTGKYLSVSTHLLLKSKITSSTLWNFKILHSVSNKENLCFLINSKSSQTIIVKNKKELEIVSTITENCTYKIEKANSNMINEIIFLIEIYQKFVEFNNYLQIKNSLELIEDKELIKFYDTVRVGIRYLKKIRKFCSNKLQSIMNPNISCGVIDFNRQTMVKKQNFFEIFCSILESCITSEIKQEITDKVSIGIKIKYSKTDRLGLIIKISNSVYSCLKKFICKNNENQIYAFKFIELYLSHAHLEIGATQFIKTLFKQNHQIATNINSSKPNIIKFYKKLLSNPQTYKKEYLEFLSSICIFKGEGITAVQEKIFFALIKRKNIVEKSISSYKIDKDNVILYLPNQKISLDSCFRNGNIIKFKNEVENFTYLIHLYANMSFGRYYESSSMFISDYSFDFINSIIWNFDFSSEIRVAFCKLLFALYIDCHPREEIANPILLKVAINLSKDSNSLKYRLQLKSIGEIGSWTHFSDEYDLKPYYESLNCLDKFITRLLSYFWSGIDLKNEFTLAIIKSVDKLIRLQLIGFGYNFYDKEVEKQFDIIVVIQSIINLLKDFEYLNHTINLSESTFKFKNIEKKNNSNPFEIDQDNKQDENSTIRCGLNFKNFFNAFNQNLFRNIEKGTIKDKIIINICKSLNSFLDLRQECFINNIFEWFCMKEEDNEFQIKNISELLPKILSYPQIPSFELGTNFFRVTKDFLPDINILSQEPFVPLLLLNFIKCTNSKARISLISVILRCYSQRKEMLKSLNKLHTVWNSEEASLLNWIKSDIQSFKHFAELSEVWLYYWKSTQKSRIKSQSTFEKMIIILDNLENFLYSDCQLTESGPASDSKILILTSRQNTLYYLNFNNLILKFIKDGVHVLLNTYNPKVYDELDEPRLRLTNLFSNCYRVLKKFVKNNPHNQKKMFKSIENILVHLHLDLGQISLVCGILKNNLELVESLDFEKIKLLADAIKNYGRQKKFLKIFNVIQVINNKPLESTQRLVLSLFVQEKLNTQLLYIKDTDPPQFDFDQQKKGIFYKDEPFKYHAALLIILSKTAYGNSKSFFNAIKCQSVISISDLFDFLFLAEINDNQYQLLKTPLLLFYMNVYIDCGFFNKEVKSYPKFLQYINLQSKKLNETDNMNPLYIDFLIIFVEILNKYRNFYIKKIQVSYYQQDDIKAIKKFAKSIYRNFSKFDSFTLSESFADSINELFKAFSIKYKIHSYSKTETHTSYDAFSKSSEFFGEENKTYKNVGWDNFKEKVLESSQVLNLIKNEDIAFATLIFNSHNFNNSVNFEKIVRSFISCMQLIKSQKFSRALQIGILKVFRTLLSDSFAVNNQPSKPFGFKKKVQNQLSYFGITEVIVYLLTQENTPMSIFKHLIALSLDLLEGPNTQIQDEFYFKFLQSPNSETFFIKLNKIFQNFLGSIHDKKPKKNSKKLVFKRGLNTTILLLKFIINVCSNFNKNWKNYFRYQFQSKDSINILSLLIQLIQKMIETQYHRLFKVLVLCLEALIKLVEGICKENQDYVLNSEYLSISHKLLSITESFNNLYSSPIETNSDTITNMTGDYLEYWMIDYLKYKCLNLLLALIEGREEPWNIGRICSIVGIRVLKDNMDIVYKTYTSIYKIGYYERDLFIFSEMGNRRELNLHDKVYCDIENGFLVYELVKYMQDSNEFLFQSNFQARTPNKTDKVPDLFKEKHSDLNFNQNQHEYLLSQEIEVNEDSSFAFFESHSGSLEIIYEQKIFRIHFPYPFGFNAINSELKKKFYEQILTDSDVGRLKYLIKKIPNIIIKLEYNYYLINLIKKYSVVYFIVSKIEILRMIGFLFIVILNLITILSYGIEIESPSLVSNDPEAKNIGEKHTNYLFKFIGTFQFTISIFLLLFFIAKEGPVIFHKANKRSKVIHKSNSKIVNYGVKVMTICALIFSNFNLIYHVCYLLFSILGTFVHPFYYSLLLLDMIHFSEYLKDIVWAIYISRLALFMIFFLFIILGYLYAILGYWQIYEDFHGNCKSLLKCMITVLDQTFKNNGGVGAYLPYSSTPDDRPFRFFYDNSYTIIVFIVIIGVIKGIIIDTFAILRQKKEIIEAERQGKCFICGLSKNFIEQNNPLGFKYHTENEHNEWNYIYYIMYLTSKNQESLTGLESHVANLFKQGSIAWIPIQISLFMGNQLKNIKFSSAINDVNSQIDLIENKLKKLE